MIVFNLKTGMRSHTKIGDINLPFDCALYFEKSLNARTTRLNRIKYSQTKLTIAGKGLILLLK